MANLPTIHGHLLDKGTKMAYFRYKQSSLAHRFKFNYNIQKSILKIYKTMPSSVQAKRIALLAKKSEQIFHLKDLGNLWNIRNPKTLRMTLKRYVDAELLYRIHRGFYSTLPLDQLDPEQVGAKALHSYCYLSTESVLYKTGYLSQRPKALTFVSAKHKNFTLHGTAYRSRQLQNTFLFSPSGIEEVNGLKTATPERAIADLLYFNPLAFFDKKVDWKRVKTMQETIGYPLTPQRYVAA